MRITVSMFRFLLSELVPALCKVISVCAVLTVALPTIAQDKWPSKTVRVVVPFPAGGGNDGISRHIAQEFGERIGVTVIVENKPGAAGTMGSEYVSKQPADGYTLLMGVVSTHAIAPSFYANLRYDPIKDFTPLTQVTDTQSVLVVHPSIPANTLQELLQLARRKPGTMNFASFGSGAWNHLAVELLNSKTGITMTHIPYKGSSPATIDLLGGRVNILLDPIINSHAHIKNGKLRALAVSSTKRSALLPDVPTLAEMGYSGFETLLWSGLFAPPNMSAQLTDRISSELRQVLRSKKVSDFLSGQGTQAWPSDSPREFSAMIQRDIVKWRGVMQAAGVQPQ